MICLFSSSGITAAHDGLFVKSGAEQCFGHAMVGFDSVINSRLGVPAEHALDMTILPASAAGIAGNKHATPLLTVILDAYLWGGLPHDYAVNVFFDCASRQAPILGASN